MYADNTMSRSGNGTLPPGHPTKKVTFWNALAGRRGVVLDGFSAAQAEDVARVVSNKADPNTFMPDVRIEDES